MMASPLALQSEQPLEQLPVRWPRVLIDFNASVHCQVLNVLYSVLRGLECRLSEEKRAEAVLIQLDVWDGDGGGSESGEAGERREKRKKLAPSG